MEVAGTNRKLPPGPMAPAMVQSVRYYRDPYGYLETCQRRYGDIFTIRQIPCGPLVHLADPEWVRLLLERQDLTGAINAYMKPMLGEGLLVLDGDDARRARAWMAPGFAPRQLDKLAAVVRPIADEELATWPTGSAIPVRPRLERLALRVIVDVIFGRGSSQRLGELVTGIHRLKSRDLATSVLAALPFGLATWRLSGEAARTKQQLDAVIEREIASPGDGMLAVLLATECPHSVRDQLWTLLFTGHETIATTLAWTFERVARTERVRATLDDCDDAYRDAVILETMRQRSTIADIARELEAPLAVGGYVLPAGTRVCPAIPLLHMRADHYPAPHEFRPERFLDAGDTRTPAPSVFLPFGGGHRRCLGASFALIEMRLVLAAALARFRVRDTDREPERGLSNGVTIGPHKGGLVTLEARA